MILENKSGYAGSFDYNQNDGIVVSFQNPYPPGSTISVSGLSEGTYEVQLYNISGQMTYNAIYNSGENFCLEGNFPEGLYLLNISSGLDVFIQEKIIISN